MLAGAASGASGQAARVIGAPIVLAHEAPFSIGDAEFSPATREVVFNGQRSVIEPRVMQLLVALHSANGAVVSKDDLTILCWEGRIVGEDAINRVVSRLRAVAENPAGGQFRIETITKVGYRLIPADQKGHAIPPEPDADHRRATVIGRRELVTSGTALAFAAAAGIGWALARQDRMPRQARMLVDEARKSLREGSMDSPGNAVGTLRQAADLAPDSAEAWGLLAYAYMIQVTAADSREGPGLRARAIAAMKRAFALEPYQADALAAQVRMIPMYRNWYECEQACRAALQRRPNHPELMCQLAQLLHSVGRISESVPVLEKALVQMPRSAPMLMGYAYSLWSLGQLDEADEAVERAFELLPRNHDTWGGRLSYLAYTGRAQEAAAMLTDRADRPSTEEDDPVATQLVNALATGDQALVRKAVQTVGAVARSGKGYVIVAATFSAFVGDNDEFFRLVNALYFNRGFTLPRSYFTRQTAPYVGHEPATAFLFMRPVAGARRDPRFMVLTSELGLDEYWTRTNSRSLVVA